MRIAFADPPYVGQAKKHYSHDPKCAEVDHVDLFAQLAAYDGWALSCSSPSLFGTTGLCAIAPEGTRMATWVKPFAVFKPNVNPAYASEPVLFKSARPNRRDVPTVRDWVSCNITLRRGLVGAKPEGFCMWLFDLIGAVPTDEFTDMFPGTGGVTAAWESWKRQTRLIA